MNVKNLFSIFILICVLYSTKLQAQDNCNCTEYVYLNEVTTGGSVHKFTVAADGSLTEIGSPWYDSADWPFQDQLVAPHGIVADLNGNVYIGEDFIGDIRKLGCDGQILPESEFVINDGGFNFGSIGNTLYTNPTSDNDGRIVAYDLCTGDLIGQVFTPLPTNSGGNTFDATDWGFYIDDNGTFYVTSNVYTNSFDENLLTVFTPTAADFAAQTSFPALITSPINTAVAQPAIGSSDLPQGDLRGITTDPAGNIYIVRQDHAQFGNPYSQIFKYSPAGVLLASSTIDTAEDGTGFALAAGIIYSASCNCLYVSTESPLEDCVTSFDLNLTQATAVVPPTGTGADAPKGIGISTECCPINNFAVDTVVCSANTAGEFPLIEFIACDGTFCEGEWNVASADATVTYETCSQSIVTSGAGCIDLSNSSDGLGDNLQCAPFQVTLRVCFDEQPQAPAISITNNVCDPETVGSINVDTPCGGTSSIEFSTDMGATWSATSPAYDAANAITVRARCVVGTDGACASPETADVTSVPEVCDTCPPVNCIRQLGEFTINKRIP